jgi:hypothetical protein
MLMRRPWPAVGAEVVRSLQSSVGRAGVRAALPRIPRALVRRRRLPPGVEYEIRVLESA